MALKIVRGNMVEEIKSIVWIIEIIYEKNGLWKGSSLHICDHPLHREVTLSLKVHFLWLSKVLWNECAIGFSLTPVFEVKHIYLG